MRVGIRTKQVTGVMAIVSLAIVVLGGWYLTSLTHILLQSNRSEAKLVSNLIFQRALHVLARGGDPIAELGSDEGLRNVLQSDVFANNMLYASICDPSGRIVADGDQARIGTILAPASDLDDLIDRQSAWARIQAVRTPGGKTFELTTPLVLGSSELGSIRVGVSTLLVWKQVNESMFWPLVTAGLVLLGSFVVAGFLAQLVLRPIHVIKSGLARLGRGEINVDVDLPPDTELSDLGTSFKQLSATLAASRTEQAGHRVLESVVDRLEDAVALFGTDGRLLFANAAMRASLGLTRDESIDDPPTIATLLPEAHPYRRTVERALAEGSIEAAPIDVPGEGERLVLTNVVTGADGRAMGALLVSRNLAYLTQIESTLSYSKKLSALNRLTAGIAHEIKNPLNATMIHLELLKMRLADRQDALEYADVIAAQVRRLDEVVQGFLKFTRPEDLNLQAVHLSSVFERLQPVVVAEAGKHRIKVDIQDVGTLSAVEGDPALLEQALLNLALNACHAMPDGGRLRIGAHESAARRVTIEVEDTGVGIPPEHLSRIFDLYFTTKPQGSGIGLSLVFRTVQLHNGEIEVQSTPGHGSVFRIQLRRAPGILQGVGA